MGNGAVLTINGVDYEVSSGSSSSACVEYLDYNTMSWTPGSYDGETSWTWGAESGSDGNHPSSPVGDNCDSDCNDVDADGVCDDDGMVAQGCMDTSACNYDTSAEEDDGSCIYAADGYDCAGECLSGVLLVLTDSWGDGWNGAVLTINGVDYEVSSGSSSSACVEYLDCNTMSWTPGSYDMETSWTWGTESGSGGNHPSSPVGDNCDSGPTITFNVQVPEGVGEGDGTLFIGGGNYFGDIGSFWQLDYDANTQTASG